MSVRHRERIKKLKKKMMAIGPVHPGRISEQFNVCGTPGCSCKDLTDPKKHGPYHYLSFTFGGKGRTVFIPKQCVAEMKKRSTAFLEFKQLYQQLIEANIDLARQEVLRLKRRH